MIRSVCIACWIGSLWMHVVIAQDVDSLYKRYQETALIKSPVERDSLSISYYADFAVYQINDKHKDAELFLDSLQQLCRASTWPKAEGIFLRVRGRYFDRQGNMDEALNMYNRAIDTLKQVGPPYGDYSTALVGAGFVLLNTGLYEESLKTLKEGYQYAVSSEHLKNQWITLNFFGDYYYYSAFRQEQFDSALYYYQRTDSLMKIHNMGNYYISDNDLGLANVYRRLGREEESNFHFNRALKLARRGRELWRYLCPVCG